MTLARVLQSHFNIESQNLVLTMKERTLRLPSASYPGKVDIVELPEQLRFEGYVTKREGNVVEFVDPLGNKFRVTLASAGLITPDSSR